MSRLRVVQVITRCVRGGAYQVVRCLLDRLPSEEFEQRLISGPEAAPAGTLVVPELVRDISPRLDVAALVRLTRIFAKERPDVVHAHTYKAGVLAAVAGRLAGIPAVLFTPHGHIFSRGAKIPGVPGGVRLESLRWITKAAQGCADRITALSEPDLQQQLALGLSAPSKYVIVRNGIDCERFAGPRPRSFEGSPLIGAVGRFSEEKGHRYLLEAMASLRRRLPGARLVLVGYGALEGDLRSRATLLAVDGLVTFAGERDSAELVGSFDVFAQPSLYESQGLAILEAMAAGVPVVATDVGGVRDAVQDGQNGLLVPPADPEALAQAIVRLAGDRELAFRLAARAGRDVRERHSASTMIESYAGLYRELLA
ncbi:MAG TPA: glycosyltransferase family 4 protein [Planctomycetota bacterium]|nr:glycosyltransferase family 4 protein [Planctomycetota bacterium]